MLEELAGCVSGRETAEELLDHKALVEELNYFLDSLPEDKRRIFVCRYFYTDSIRDIARRFGMSYAGVTMTLNRLRSKLHAYLTKRGYDL